MEVKGERSYARVAPTEGTVALAAPSITVSRFEVLGTRQAEAEQGIPVP